MIPKWLSWFRSLVYGETPGGNHYPIQVDANGKLQIDADVTGDIFRSTSLGRRETRGITSTNPNAPDFIDMETNLNNHKQMLVQGIDELGSLTFRFFFANTVIDYFDKQILFSPSYTDNKLLIPYPGCDKTELNDITVQKDITHYYRLHLGFSKVSGSADFTADISWACPRYLIM